MITSKFLGFALLAVIYGSGNPETKNTAPIALEIALSPYYTAADAGQIREALVRLAFEMPLGSRLRIHDAYNLKLVAAMDLPPPQQYTLDTPQLRSRVVRQPLNNLMTWFKEQASPQPASELNQSAALRLPEWLEQVATIADALPRSILVIGSPIRVSPAEPDFSMSDLRVPSDQHLRVGLDASPYGTRDKANRLAAQSIHWCYLGESVWGNPLHRTLVTRFWHLFVSQQGGRLANFSPDIKGVLTAALTSTRAPETNYELNPDDTKLEMRLALPRQLPAWMPGVAATTNPPIRVRNNAPPSAKVSPTTMAPPANLIPVPGDTIEVLAPAPMRVRADKVEFAVGLMWNQSSVDLDLYVKPTPSATELCFYHTRTKEGVYFHDYRNRNDLSGRQRQDYECAELTVPTDIRLVEVWVNYFEGNSPSPEGTAVVWYRGHQYQKAFSLRAAHGNRGADLNQRTNSPYWIKIPVAEIVGAMELR